MDHELQRALLRQPGCLDPQVLPPGPVMVRGRRREAPCDPVVPLTPAPFRKPPGIPAAVPGEDAAAPFLVVGNREQTAVCQTEGTSGDPVTIEAGALTAEFDCENLVPALTSAQLNYLDTLDLEAAGTLTVEAMQATLKLTPAQAVFLRDALDALQDEADTQALTQARDQLNCYWYNVEQRQDCPAGAVLGDGNPSIVAAGTVGSLVSQEDADAQAAAAALAGLRCVWLSQEVTRTCEDLGYTEEIPNTDGRTGSVTVEAGRFTSTAGQAEADQQATAYADSLLTCFYISPEVNAACVSTDSEETLTLAPGSSDIHPAGAVKILAGYLTSEVSSDDAEAQAQALADSLLDCFWWNQEQTVTCPSIILPENDPDGVVYAARTGAGNPVTIPAGTLTSYESRDDANTQAHNLGLAQLVCLYCNAEIPAICIVGDSMDQTTGVPAGTYCASDPRDAQALAKELASIPIRAQVNPDQAECKFGNDYQEASCLDGGLNAFAPGTVGLSPRSYPAPGSKVTMAANTVIVSSLDNPPGSKDRANQQAALILRGLLNCFFENTAQIATCAHLTPPKDMDTAPGAVNTAVTPAGLFFSDTSLQDANAQAWTAALDRLNCFYTNTAVHQTCTGTGNAPLTGGLGKAAPATATGTVNEADLSPGAVFSEFSTADATAQAVSIAQLSLKCFWVNEPYEATCQKDRGKTGVSSLSIDHVKVAAATFTSYTNQAEADNFAKEMAKEGLDCFWTNAAYTATCAKDLHKLSVSPESTDNVKVAADTFTSYTSQAEANGFAKDSAVQSLNCFWRSKYYKATCAQEGKDGCDGGSTDNVEAQAGAFTSYTSQDEADNFAKDSARQGLNCFWSSRAANSDQSCPENTIMVQQGYVGPGIIKSFISQSDADTPAQALANALNICMPVGLAGNDGPQTGCDGDCFGYFS